MTPPGFLTPVVVVVSSLGNSSTAAYAGIPKPIAIDSMMHFGRPKRAGQWTPHEIQGLLQFKREELNVLATKLCACLSAAACHGVRLNSC